MTKITQRMLGALLLDYAQVKDLKNKVKDLEADIKDRETNIIAALEAGATIEKGRFMPTLVQMPGQCRPPWKEVHLEHMLAEHLEPKAKTEETVRAQYPAEPYTALHIGIFKGKLK